MATRRIFKLVVFSSFLILAALSILLSCDKRRGPVEPGKISSSKVANVIVMLSPGQVHMISPQAIDSVDIIIAVTDSNGLGMQGVNVSVSRTPQSGLITQPDTTDFQGLTKSVFVTEAGRYDSISITASAGNVSERRTLYITGPSNYSLNLTYSPNTPKLIDHAGSPYVITGVLVDTTQRGVSGQAVTFIVQNEVGRIGFSDTNVTVPRTNTSGEVQALFYNTELDEVLLPDSAIIQAVTTGPGGGILAETIIIPLRRVHNSLRLVATPDQLVSDGTSSISVRAFLLDTYNHAIVGDTVKFRNIEGDGPITAVALTDATGGATVTFTPSGRVNQPQQSRIVADFRLGSSVHEAICTTAVALLPVRSIGSITVSLQKQNVVANGNDSSLIFITVQDSLGGLIADGTTVYLRKTGPGLLSAQQAATSAGTAVASIKAPSNIVNGPKVDSIFVRSDVSDTIGFADTVIVQYIPGPISALAFLRPIGTVILVAGSGQTDTIEVIATDANGNTVANGTQIRFRNTLDSSSTLTPESAPTDSGVARSIYLVGPDIGDDNVVAFIPDPGNPNDTITTDSPVVYHCISSEATTMDLMAVPPYIEVGGQSTQIIATLQDAFGNPLSEGYDVAFDITVAPGGCDGVNWRPSFDAQNLVQHDTAETNVNGQAIIQLYSGCHSGAVAIRACTVSDSLFVCNEKSLVTISSGPPSWISISLTGVGEAVGGFTPERFVQVAAIVGDRFSNPVDYGTAVYFTLIPANFADIEGNSTTGTPRLYHPDSTNGVAYTRIIYSCFNTFDTVRVVASSAGDSAEVVDTSRIFTLPIYNGTLSIGASPGNLWIDSCSCNCAGGPSRNCRDTSLITVLLRDGGGCPIEGGDIRFSALVAGFIIMPDQDYTDDNGVAQCQYYLRGCDIPLNPEGTQASIETRVRAVLFGVASDVSAEANIVASRRPTPPCANIAE
jgi:hypothetical protein